MKWILALLAVIELGGCDKVLGLDPIPPPDAPTPPAPSSWLQVTGGQWHTCGIHFDGTLWCWGHNQFGQVDPTDTNSELVMPHQVGTATWLAVAAAVFHTCGIQADHSLWCWGDNGSGELGTGDTAPSTTLVNVPGSWTAVTTNGDVFITAHTCAIDAMGTAWCWGSDQFGQLGDGQVTGSLQVFGKTMVAGGPWRAISAGQYYTCAIAMTGAVWCWGSDLLGQIGSPAGGSIGTPFQVGTDTYTAIATSVDTTCAIRTDGHLRCWGDGVLGQLGNDNTIDSSAPVAVDNDLETDWVDVAAAGFHVCARRASGSVYCWGDNLFGELASDTGGATYAAVPTAIAIPTGAPATFATLGLGYTHTCATDTDAHGLWCAGSGGLGQLATIGSHPTPTRIGSAALSTVSVGAGTSCAIGGGTLWCWGENARGAVGDGSALERQAPVQITSNTWTQVAVGDHACAIDSTKALYCWGFDLNGAVGDMTTTGKNVLAPVHVADGIAAVTASQHTCIGYFPGLECFGLNDAGQCGQPAGTAVTWPEYSSELATTWSAVAAGKRFSCGITSGAVECWGAGSFGQLGNGTYVVSSAPVMVKNLPATMDRVSAGTAHACAGSGTQLWCWGLDLSGQLGNQGTTSSNVPVAVPGAWGAVAAGADHTCAISSGSLSCWGSNAFGQLGDSTFLDHHEPRPVGTDTDWAQVAAGAQDTCALKLDGSLWCWGRNDVGQVGDGTAWRSDLERVP